MTGGDKTNRNPAHAAYIRLTGSTSTITHAPLPKDDPVRRNPDISRAAQLLGWHPRVSLEQGLTETIAYFRRLLAGG